MKLNLPKLIAYRKGDLWGFCNKERRIVIPIKYDKVGVFIEGFVKVSLNGKWGFINEKGEEVTEIVFDDVEDFRNGYAKVNFGIKKKNEKINFDVSIKKTVYSQKLNSSEIDSLCLIVNKMNISNDKNHYGGGVMDGVIWTFSFEQNKLIKTISFDNYYSPKYDLFLEYINKLIPVKRRYISFDIFNIKSDFQNK